MYTLRNAAGEVVRTGRARDLARRELEHLNDPRFRDLRFQVEYRSDNGLVQRGLEQMLYDRYPEAQIVNGGFNMIRPVAPSNPNLPIYLQAATDFLEGGGL